MGSSVDCSSSSRQMYVTQVVFQRKGKITQQGGKLLTVLFGHARRHQLLRQAAAHVEQGTPLPAAFPPTIVRRIGAEHEQQRDHETQGGIDERKGCPTVFRCLRAAGYEKSVPPKGVHRNARSKMGSSLRNVSALVEPENKPEPVFWIVLYHPKWGLCTAQICTNASKKRYGDMIPLSPKPKRVTNRCVPQSRISWRLACRSTYPPTYQAAATEY